jgi:hypothetical protein
MTRKRGTEKCLSRLTTKALLLPTAGTTPGLPEALRYAADRPRRPEATARSAAVKGPGGPRPFMPPLADPSETQRAEVELAIGADELPSSFECPLFYQAMIRGAAAVYYEYSFHQGLILRREARAQPAVI